MTASCRLKADAVQRCRPARAAIIYEGARDMARALARACTARRLRARKVEMLFAHLKRILKLDRLRLRGPSGAQFEFLLAATAQNLRKLAKLIARPPPNARPCVA